MQQRLLLCFENPSTNNNRSFKSSSFITTLFFLMLFLFFIDIFLTFFPIPLWFLTLLHDLLRFYAFDADICESFNGRLLTVVVLSMLVMSKLAVVVMLVYVWWISTLNFKWISAYYWFKVFFLDSCSACALIVMQHSWTCRDMLPCDRQWHIIGIICERATIRL